MQNSCCSVIQNLKLQCPYTESDIYLAFIISWCTLWGTFLLVNILLSINYNTDDFRYYMSIEKMNRHWSVKLCIFLVSSLTIFGWIFVLIKL
jgi:hypothetical protein